MTLIVIIFSLHLMAQVASGSPGCDKSCGDYYYGCVQNWYGVPHDQPNEEIDCKKDKDKLSCPEYCQLCSACEFVTQSELDSKIL